MIRDSAEGRLPFCAKEVSGEFVDIDRAKAEVSGDPVLAAE
jgi:hypothetical protein